MLNNIKKELNSSNYDFLKTDAHLNKNIMLLGLGGSYAYGTQIEGISDIDIRGIALNSKKEILLNKDFEQVVDTDTDTTIYSFNKMIELLSKMNPNTCELLGLKKDHYLYLSSLGKELLKVKKIFLSKICIHTFGGYANSSLRRLQNKAVRFVSQSENEAYIRKSIDNARYEFKNRYYPCTNNDVNLYIDKAINEDYDSEIFMDVNLKHYPLRDWVGMWNEMKSIVNSYNKIGRRNEKAMAHNKIAKHMMNLFRSYIMCIDILEKEEIITYREKEHNLLMDIRNGKYLDEKGQPTSEFYDILNEYEKRFDYAKENTSLPDKPDYQKIEEFKMYINEKIVKGEL